MKREVTFFLGATLATSLVLTACGSNGTSTSSSNQTKSTAISSKSNKTGNFVLDYVPKKKNGFTVGFSNGYFGNTWRSQYVDGAKAIGDKLKKEGVLKDLIIQNTNGVPDQIAAIQNMINQGVDALVIDPVSSSSLSAVVAKAVSKGILVIIDDDPANYPNTINVTNDNYAFWKIQAKWLAEQLHGKGNIVEITGIAGNSADQLRQKAANDVLKNYPNIHVLASAPGGWDETKAKQAMSNFLSAYKNIDGILEQDVMADGVLQAYKAAGKQPPVMTGDYTYGFLRKWKNQYPNLNTMTTPYAPGVGADGVEVAVRLLEGYKLKPNVLVQNPLQPGVKNTIMNPAPYVVTKTADPNGAWMKGLDSRTKAIGLDDALKIGKGQPDGASLDSVWSEQDLDSLFSKPAK
ncbi:substrate-binding domain-containing protein [Fodinisporobacter ferrooxydans]|uniref:Substrate-binding domain-containing protein n=1 Tax=Fodinisporobacter ferrooxydans TaxID=2901836 RepID=A0ABY4CP45_9BACL|nr:substrate-binding domain-containing protein [Alicyclobacillaceae bacterium MYW30-H2]